MMKIQNSTPSFKARTTILSHNNILSAEQILRLKKMGESIGNNDDSIWFNVRNFKKNKIVVAYDVDIKSAKDKVSVEGSIMSNKWLLKPENFIKKILTGVGNLIKNGQ